MKLNARHIRAHARAREDIERIERRGVLAARALTRKIRQAVLAAYKRGETVFSLKASIVEQLQDLLRDAMVAVHLKGLLREKDLVQGLLEKQLRLSVFDKTLKALAKLAEVERINLLQAQYDTEALRILEGVSDKVEARLRQTVNELVSEGAHVSEGVEVLREQFDRLGLTDAKEYQLEAIFRTQTQIAYNAGRWDADQAPEIQEILWGYEYSATDDDRVRETHWALDGTRAPKDDPIWGRIWPPNGWNCRCQVIPLFEPEKVDYPPQETPDGEPVQPDPGFNFNPGKIFFTGRAG